MGLFGGVLAAGLGLPAIAYNNPTVYAARARCASGWWQRSLLLSRKLDTYSDPWMMVIDSGI